MIRTVGRDYKTIQDAINACLPGDEVFVPKGVYTETVRIEKSGITLRGERGPNGEQLTILDGRREIEWQHAPEIHPWCWKTDQLVQAAWHGDRQISLLNDDFPYQIVSEPRDFEIDLADWNHAGTITFYDIIYGAMQRIDGRYVIRERDGADMSGVTINSDTPCIFVRGGAKQVHIRDLKIIGWRLGIAFQQSAGLSSVRQCEILGGSPRIQVADGSHDIEISKNLLSGSEYARDPGAGWMADDQDALDCTWIYRYYKNTEKAYGYSIHVHMPGDRITICNNIIRQGGNGIFLDSKNEPNIAGICIDANTFENHASCGVLGAGGLLGRDAAIRNNWFYDNNIHIRFHVSQQNVPYDVQISKNRMSQPQGRGYHFFVHWSPGSPPPGAVPRSVRITDNWLHRGFALKANGEQAAYGMEWITFDENIASCDWVFYLGDESLQSCHGNWLHGAEGDDPGRYVGQPWFTNNILSAVPMWPEIEGYPAEWT